TGCAIALRALRSEAVGRRMEAAPGAVAPMAAGSGRLPAPRRSKAGRQRQAGKLIASRLTPGKMTPYDGKDDALRRSAMSRRLKVRSAALTPMMQSGRYAAQSVNLPSR